MAPNKQKKPKTSKEPMLSASSPTFKRLTKLFTKAKAEEHQNPRLTEHGPGSNEKRMKIPDQESSLLALPAELRNEIWQLAMARQWPKSVDFYLGFAELYQCSQLLSCCRQVKDEAKTFFHEARDQLLKETEFVMTVRPAGSLKEYLKEQFRYIDSFKDDDIADIQSLRLCSPIESTYLGEPELPTCMFRGGSWHWQWLHCDPSIRSSCRVILLLKSVRHEVERGIPSNTMHRFVRGRQLSLKA